MCGITGVLALSEAGRSSQTFVEKAVDSLVARGPDRQGAHHERDLSLGHARLCVIDTSEAADQPFSDPTGRYTIVFNGEIYNFKILRSDLRAKGYAFRTDSDTEVLLYQFMEKGIEGLSTLEGFFAFAIYDKATGELFLARDRMGIKPLLYYRDEDRFLFGSQMRAMMAYDMPRELDVVSLATYLQLTYIPAPATILQGVCKVMPGEYLRVNRAGIEQDRYYELPAPSVQKPPQNYSEACRGVHERLERSVQQRLVSDVPLGAFLSGGVDSSVIATLASRHVDKLKTFSIGYQDAPYFDETRYARMVSDKIGSEHHVFSLSEDDLFEHLDQVLEAIDEPFADSSAIAVHMLCQRTREEVTVALSGDGADELFGGYNKHRAEAMALRKNALNVMARYTGKLWELVPASRQGKWGNKVRQMRRYSRGVALSPHDRYWEWASWLSEKDATCLLAIPYSRKAFEDRKAGILRSFGEGEGVDAVLRTDLSLVLPNDMLTKVDLMSMDNSLEVRTPFLDHEVVEYAFSLPTSFKVDHGSTKKVLRDAFRQELPEGLLTRPKQGFEVPLREWVRERMQIKTDTWLGETFLREQGIFSPEAVQAVLARLHSRDPGDSASTVWALLVFQHWWDRYMNRS